jgi:hypothetical protein
MSMPASMPMSMAMGGHHSAPDDGTPPSRQPADQCHQHCSVQTSRVALHAPATLSSISIASRIVFSAPASGAVAHVEFPHSHPFSTAPPAGSALPFLI